jgi:hypothetical protein
VVVVQTPNQLKQQVELLLIVEVIDSTSLQNLESSGRVLVLTLCPSWLLLVAEEAEKVLVLKVLEAVEQVELFLELQLLLLVKLNMLLLLVVEVLDTLDHQPSMEQMETTV